MSCTEGVTQRERICHGIGDCKDPERLGTIQTKPCVKKECCPGKKNIKQLLHFDIKVTCPFSRFCIYIVQCKVAGQSGGTGSHVQSHVPMELKKGEEHAPNPFHSVGAPVGVQRKKPPLASLKRSVQVSMSLFSLLTEDAEN